MRPILLDEMYDGKDKELSKSGYEVHSVKKLIRNGKRLRSDYSVIKYAELNKMILITEEGDNFKGCRENNIPCILLEQNPPIDLIVKKLQKYKHLRK